MIARLRLLLALARPSVVVLLVFFTVAGLAQAGGTEALPSAGLALVAVLAYLLFSVVVNDLSDEASDRVTLPGDAGRPLVGGRTHRRHLWVVALAGAAVSLGASGFLSGPACATVAVGLGLSAAYSLRPIRIADRGAVASLLLPAGYVAVPVLVGIFSVRSTLTVRDVLLVVGLYVGFIGRIVLKDFRDVRGDALFGKRTFLVRHGRRATCQLSAVSWVGGAAVVLAIRSAGVELVLVYVASVVMALVLLRSLARDRGPRRDEAVISALALVGRGTVVTVIGHLVLVDAGWSTPAYRAALVALLAITVGQVLAMAHHGPRTHLTTADVPGAGGVETGRRLAGVPARAVDPR